MKGLILCGGKGTRMRPFTYAVAKHLLPVANRPVIYYTIENMQRAGIRDIYILVGAEDQEFKYKFGDGSRLGVSITYITQQNPLGLAHGVMTSREYLKDGTFITILGDNIISHSISDIVGHHYNADADCTILLSKVKHPERYGIATLEGGEIVSLIEKPRNPQSNNAMVGIYVFNNKIFDAIERIKPSKRGELELTDAIMEMIKAGARVSYQLTSGWWMDVGRPEDLLEANRYMLTGIQRNIRGKIDSNSRVSERVIIGQDSIIEDTVIEGNVIIGSNVVIKKSHVGPYTSVGNGSRLTGVFVRDSIIMENCILDGQAYQIHNSIIGSGSSVKAGKYHGNISMWIGQYSKIQ